MLDREVVLFYRHLLINLPRIVWQFLISSKKINDVIDKGNCSLEMFFYLSKANYNIIVSEAQRLVGSEVVGEGAICGPPV